MLAWCANVSIGVFILESQSSACRGVEEMKTMVIFIDTVSELGLAKIQMQTMQTACYVYVFAYTSSQNVALKIPDASGCSLPIVGARI